VEAKLLDEREREREAETTGEKDRDAFSLAFY
jgi:hypothetical protein